MSEIFRPGRSGGRGVESMTTLKELCSLWAEKSRVPGRRGPVGIARFGFEVIDPTT